MSKQRLCVTVTAATMADLRRRRDASVDADLVELRLDSVDRPDVAGALADRRCAVIVTCRPRWEGGAFAGSEDERRRVLRDALDAGAEYVDVEWRAGFQDVVERAAGRRIILSSHDFAAMPTDLDSRVSAMKASGAEIIKIAVAPSTLSDLVTLRHLASNVKEGLLTIAMGERGLISRVLPSCFHSPWAYAGDLAGIGQVQADTLVTEFRFREIGSETALYGLVGLPVSHSVSPAMHNAAFRSAGIDGVYLPFPVSDIDDFLTFAGTFGIRGASVTIPHKVALRDRVARLSESAANIGAINTLRHEDGGWLGDNSDVQGFLEPLRARFPLAGARASLLGAGGAARAVAIALATQGARVSVHARNRQRAAAVADLAQGSVGPWPPERGSWDLLVNCTPIGMHPDVDDTPVPADRLASGTVYDLVYNPRTTKLLREAAAAGCQAIGGLDMLVGQARQQFEWWTGVRPSAAVMRDAAARKLGAFETQETETPAATRRAG